MKHLNAKFFKLFTGQNYTDISCDVMVMSIF